MADIIQQRRDTAARWAQYNPILLEGEVGYVTDNPNQYKIGNGRDRWNDLPFRGYTGTITQDTGDDENAVMSQKATTEKLSELGSDVRNLDAVLSGYIDKETLYNNQNYGYGSYVSVFYPIVEGVKNYKIKLTSIVLNGKRLIVRLTNAISPYSSALVRNIATVSSGVKLSEDIVLSDEELETVKYIAVFSEVVDSEMSFISTLEVLGDNISSLKKSIEELDNKKYTYFRICSTESNESAKILTNIPGFELSREVRLVMSFENVNTADNVTLDVNGTGAYPLFFNRMRCSSKNKPSPRAVLDVYFDGENYYAYEIGGIGEVEFEYDGYISTDGEFITDVNFKTSNKIYVSSKIYACYCSYISKYDRNGNFVERVTASTTGFIEFDDTISFIRISQPLSEIGRAYYYLYLDDVYRNVVVLQREIKGAKELLDGLASVSFVKGLPQIKELYLLQGTTINSIIWIRKGFVSSSDGTYWGIAFDNGAETEQYTSQPNGVIPIYSSPSHATIVGYVIVDWSLQSVQSASGAGKEILPTSYNLENAWGISVYQGIFNQKQGLLQFAKQIAEIVKDNRVAAENEINLVNKFSKAAICWIDDDFMVNDDSASEKYAALKKHCENKGYYADMALIPSDKVGIDNNIGTLDTKIDAVREWENVGFRFLYHPVHYGWYTNDWNTQDAIKVKERLVESIRLFLQNAIILKERILVCPGSSNTFADNVEIIKKYCDCAITTVEGVNNGVSSGRYQLKRIFPESLFAQGKTKTEIKGIIAEAVNNNAWIILGSHVHSWIVSDTLDETSMTTANLFDIMDYANDLCPIRPTEECWNLRKPMFDWYGK